MSYNIIASMPEATVVAEDTVQYGDSSRRKKQYQSEAELEKDFIKLLCEEGYEYLSIHAEAELVANLRHCLEELNAYHFSDKEWDRFFKDNIANDNEGIVEKTRKIQEDYVQVLKRDNGASQNIYLINKENIHKNKLQVINQYVENRGAHDTRYDVT